MRTSKFLNFLASLKYLTASYFSKLSLPLLTILHPQLLFSAALYQSPSQAWSYSQSPFLLTWYQIHTRSFKYQLCVRTISKLLFPAHISSCQIQISAYTASLDVHASYILQAVISPTSKLLILLSSTTPEPEEPSVSSCFLTPSSHMYQIYFLRLSNITLSHFYC